MAEIRERGFTVVEGFLDAAQAAAVREEAMEAAHASRLPAHRFYISAATLMPAHVLGCLYVRMYVGIL